LKGVRSGACEPKVTDEMARNEKERIWFGRGRWLL
jgi:hypothetical protein